VLLKPQHFGSWFFFHHQVKSRRKTKSIDPHGRASLKPGPGIREKLEITSINKEVTMLKEIVRNFGKNT
jgi:hypothetical protein